MTLMEKFALRDWLLRCSDVQVSIILGEWNVEGNSGQLAFKEQIRFARCVGTRDGFEIHPDGYSQINNMVADLILRDDGTWRIRKLRLG